MAKQPARLSDFEIPRGEGPSTEAQVVQDAPATSEMGAIGHGQVKRVNDQVPTSPNQADLAAVDVVPMRIAPRPAVEARQAMTVRLPVSMHERIRVLMFVSRRSQQDIVEDALNAFLHANMT